MIDRTRQHGFSLTETLLAVGTLAIGLTFIAGTFLTGIYFSTVSTERTIGAVVADEAFAKMRIFGIDPNATLGYDGFASYADLVSAMPVREYYYPSTDQAVGRQYSWSALCRRMEEDGRLLQCTVFVCRRAGTSSTYYVRKSDSLDLDVADLPRPVRVQVVQAAMPADANEVSIEDAVPSDGIDELAFVNDGSVLVGDETGQIYRVLERFVDRPDTIRLDEPWDGDPNGWGWVVPPATSGGRNPVVAVYQEVIRIPDR